jgi:UDP-glucose 4-epimerase
MASAVGVRLIMEQPVKTIETIFHGTDVVLGRCSKYRKRVLIPSTSEVYGKGISVPFKEEDDLLTGATDKHRWAYACAKTLDEFLQYGRSATDWAIRNGRAAVRSGSAEE